MSSAIAPNWDVVLELLGLLCERIRQRAEPVINIMSAMPGTMYLISGSECRGSQWAVL